MQSTRVSVTGRSAFLRGEAVPSSKQHKALDRQLFARSVSRSRKVHLKGAPARHTLRTCSVLANSTSTDTETQKSKQRARAVMKQKFASSVQALVLGGGSTSDHTMAPLTTRRAKPAIPFGGCYRLIDIILSNLIHSGLTQIFVLTQYNSHSLNSHVSAAYPLTHFQANNSSFVEVIAATQTPDSKEWSKGSADAVRRCIHELPQNPGAEAQLKDWIVLSGEHLYRMDYSLMIEQHRANDADITVSCTSVSPGNPALYGVDGQGLGLVHIDPEDNILSFAEKPDQTTRDQYAGVSKGSTDEKPYVASMGLYVFKVEVLKKLLQDHSLNDFGGDVLPAALAQGLKVQGYVFDDYWEDISTLRAFFDANLALAEPNPPFELENPKAPTFTLPRTVPPAKLVGDCDVVDSLIADGCFVQDTKVKRSVLGMNSTVASGCCIEDSLVMGHDTLDDKHRGSGAIGEGCVIKGAIIDKNVEIGAGSQIVNQAGVEEGGSEEEGYLIRSGIVTVLRDAVIPPNTII